MSNFIAKLRLVRWLFAETTGLCLNIEVIRSHYNKEKYHEMSEMQLYQL